SPRRGAVSTPAASSRSSVSPKSAPRGTASVSGPSGGLDPPTCPGPLDIGSRPLASPRLLLHLGDVDALQVEGEAGRGQGEAELGEEAVVAAAAAQHVAHRRVVDLEDRAAVVAEVAQQA